MPRLAHSLNRTVLAAIPALFGSDDPQLCLLVDVETCGLWLTGEVLRARRTEGASAETELPAEIPVFIPFAQILYLSDPAPQRTLRQLLQPAPGEAKAATPSKQTPKPAKSAQVARPARTNSRKKR